MNREHIPKVISEFSKKKWQNLKYSETFSVWHHSFVYAQPIISLLLKLQCCYAIDALANCNWLPLTSRKKEGEDNCLSYPPWRHFGSPIVLLLLRTNKPIRINFLSIFLEDFRGPRKMVFILKSSSQRVQVIMAHCWPNLQTSRVLFSFLKWRHHFFGT